MQDWSARIRNALAEFRRRRVFRVAAVYLLVGWLLVQVADATFEPMGFPAWAPRLLIVMLALGFVLCPRGRPAQLAPLPDACRGSRLRDPARARPSRPSQPLETLLARRRESLSRLALRRAMAQASRTGVAVAEVV